MTRYLVLAHKDWTARFYRVGAVLADTHERSEADDAFLYSPKAQPECVVMYAFDERSPDGRELSSRF